MDLAKLLKLNNDLLRDIVPAVGPRMTILQKIEEYKTDKDCGSSRAGSNYTPSETSSIDSNHITNDQSWTVIPISDNELIASLGDRATSNVPFDSFPDFDLTMLLQTTPMGSSILKYYETYNTLNKNKRSLLVDIVIKHLFNYLIKR